jgi:predicted dehydrogenase
MLVCTPPTTKQEYILLANGFGIPCFTEADIMSYKGEYYPSRTMVFNPAIVKINQFLKTNMLGKVCAFNYHMGQFLPSWHVGADMKKYYAAQKDTSGVLEMTAFELSWLSFLFGMPTYFNHCIDKSLNLENVSADDIITAVVSFDNGGKKVYGTMLIDTVSNPATRDLKIIFENGTLFWNWDKDYILVQAADGATFKIYVEKGQPTDGYNKNISDDMYSSEIQNFIKAIAGQEDYNYSFILENKISKIMEFVRGGF